MATCVGTHRYLPMNYVANGTASSGYWQTKKIKCDKFLPGMIALGPKIEELHNSIMNPDRTDSKEEHMQLVKTLNELVPVVLPNHLAPAVATMQSRMNDMLGSFLPAESDTDHLSHTECSQI